MIRVSRLREAIGDGDWVVVTPQGEVVDMAIPRSAGPATMVVKPVTDALKLGDRGRLTASVDRDQTWAVEVFVLNRIVIDKLEPEELTDRDLIDAVEQRRLAWQFIEPEAE